MTFAKTKGHFSFNIGLSNLIFFFAKLLLMPEVFHIILNREVNSDMSFLSQRGLFS